MHYENHSINQTNQAYGKYFDKSTARLLWTSYRSTCVSRHLS